MELEFRFRNNDMGPIVPTFQERVNAMLPAAQAGVSSAAPVLEPRAASGPHMLSGEETDMALALVEEASHTNAGEFLQAHSSLNAQRVARLLDLLD